jgi:leucyl aminopeptidase
MRSAVVLPLALLVACTSAPLVDDVDPYPAEHGRRWLTIGVDALDSARAAAAATGTELEVVEHDGAVAVIAFDASAFRALSEAIHADHHRCGGFFAHDSLDGARRARTTERSLVAPTTPDYTLDDAALVEAVLPDLEAARIVAGIQQLAAYHNRYYLSPTGVAAANDLRALWAGLSTRDDVTAELYAHDWPQKSVILTIPGTTHPDEIVVLGGHLDSIAPGGSSARAPGADDNASGIAVLTEVARVLLAADYRPARTIRFMAYAAEEVGLRGSEDIAEAYKAADVNVVGVLQVDMANYQGSDKDMWLIQDYTNAPQNAFVEDLIDTYVGATWGVDQCGYACSDHASWHRAGFAASMPHEAKVFENNPNIHTPDDTLANRDTTGAHALKFARMAAAFAVELGEGQLGDPGPGPDAGPDGGGAPDAGPDAGDVPDAGPDAGDIPDAGPDAGDVPDAGPIVPDAGPIVPDAGPIVPDAAPADPDAAPDPVEPDAGDSPGDDTGGGAGCCSASDDTAGPIVLALAVLAGCVPRRRRSAMRRRR